MPLRAVCKGNDERKGNKMKEVVRQYAEAAFRCYFTEESPCLPAEKEDRGAVERVLKRISPEEQKALRLAYGQERALWGEREQELAALAGELFITPRSVYRWLLKARMLFAEERGLRFYG